MQPKVSVSITTYNHEKYIAQAIDSVLMQKTDFDYEIIIGEDDSSDQTRAIVQAYQQKYPDKIRLFLNSRANVIYINGKPTGRWNFVNNLKHAQGQYVALLEGDDYWTSPYKLQTQVDLLDARPDCALCAHPVLRFSENGTQKSKISGPPVIKEAYTLADLLERNFIPTCSVMFRNHLFDDFPDWYYTTPMGDWPLHILNTRHGDIGFINKPLAAHRMHDGGLWSTQNVANRQKTKVAFLKLIREYLGPEYYQTIDNSLARWHLIVLRALLQEKKYQEIGSTIMDLMKERNLSPTILIAAWRAIAPGKSRS